MKNRLLWMLLSSMAILVASISFAGPPSKGVSLKVTIENCLSDAPTCATATPTQVRDDSFGEYVDGDNGLYAKIDGGGLLHIDFWSNSGQPIRDIYTNHEIGSGQPYSGPAGTLYTSNHPATGFQYRPHLDTAAPQDSRLSAFMPMQSMTNGSSQCISLMWNSGPLSVPNPVPGSITAWRDTSHYGTAASINDDATAYGVVTRVDADTWTVESPVFQGKSCVVGSTLPVSLIVHDEVTSISRKGATTTVVKDGYYYLPYKLTLRRK